MGYIYISVVCATFALRIVDPDQVIVAPCWHLSAPLDEDFFEGAVTRDGPSLDDVLNLPTRERVE